ncbi:uncharacterized protein LOC111058861 isoform X2 [Nilaparvata lugens]|uniref:uncharacterized protein LOC111058861 isoform X2 n=1 Tax=Nilaparvata lugens TaxID=108931 RepID=UPI00193E05B9|nr:uncharacterized protein LOC111058861 isoform X2 [Nilaparvata lugens]
MDEKDTNSRITSRSQRIMNLALKKMKGDSEKESNVPPTGERYKTGDIYESEKAEGETSKHVTEPVQASIEATVDDVIALLPTTPREQEESLHAEGSLHSDDMFDDNDDDKTWEPHSEESLLSDDIIDNTDDDETWEPPSKRNRISSIRNILSNSIINNDNLIVDNDDRVEDIVIPDSDSDTTEPSTKRVRKRFRNVSQWKKNAAKLKRNSGQAYVNSRGKSIDAKSVKPSCDLRKCRLKCSSKISEEQRALILNRFYDLGDVTRQRDWILKNIEKIEPKYRYAKEGSNRAFNVAYFLFCDENKIQVCRTFFLNTLNISKTVVSTALKKFKNNFLEPECRGKHENRKKNDDLLIQGMKDFINSIPRVESHYLRNQTAREYIDGGKTLSDIHRDYQNECLRQNLPHGNYTAFRKVFIENFNISFFVPKKDLCCLCEQFKNSPDDNDLKKMHETHIKLKELAREEKKKDALKAKNKECVTAIFDLQAVLPTPCGDASLFYYKRRLSTLNFTIYDIGNSNAYCYVWNEAYAKRGCNEIGSCLLLFLEKVCQGKDVIFYSDNCPGQNKNQAIAAAFIYAVENLNVKSVTHKFLTVGHTQNEGDMVHSLIEKQKKLVLRSGPVSVPAQWITDQFYECLPVGECNDTED